MDETACRFVGGMRYEGARASWPLAELSITSSSARVKLRSAVLRRLLRRWLPTVEVPLGGAVVDPVRGMLPGRMSQGVRLRSHLDGAEVIFWSSKRRALVEILTARGASLGNRERVL
jgi:hypothetical protein